MTEKENISLVTRYLAMIRRCYNKRDRGYKNYGGRGVVVCDEWLLDIRKFIDWSLNNGFSIELEIDKDIRGDGLVYSPETCMWTTREENQNNRRDCKKYLFNGRWLTVAQISKTTGIQEPTLEYRLKNKDASVWNAISEDSQIVFGESHVCAKLTSNDVISARKMRKMGKTYDDIYKEFGGRISKSSIVSCIVGRTWGHLNHIESPKNIRRVVYTKKQLLIKEKPKTV